MSSVLSRFRKPGGFQQLLVLIETCDPVKQKNLLNLIGAEDPGWAHLVKLKSLTFERVLSWPQEVLMEITPHLPDQLLAIVHQMAGHLKNQGPELQQKWLASLPSIKQKQIVERSQTLKLSTPEQAATTIKLLQLIRELESKGQIRFATFDPLLEIDRQIAA